MGVRDATGPPVAPGEWHLIGPGHRKYIFQALSGRRLWFGKESQDLAHQTRALVRLENELRMG